jgi:predicted  nucleic acid-binding Zn-ribbon protein
MADSYIDDLKQRLRRLEHEMQEARRRIDTGQPADRVRASGDLAELEARHKELERRLADAEKHHAGDWSDTHRGLRQELDSLGDALERWTTSHVGGRKD